MIQEKNACLDNVYNVSFNWKDQNNTCLTDTNVNYQWSAKDLNIEQIENIDLLNFEINNLKILIEKSRDEAKHLDIIVENYTNELIELLTNLLETSFRRINLDQHKVVSFIFNSTLKVASKLDELPKHKLIRFAIEFLTGFRVMNLDDILCDYQHAAIKQIVVDFLFEMKDKLSFSTFDVGESLDVFYEVMDFVFAHNLEPSKDLQERYSESDINRALGFPEYEDGPKQIGMSQSTYLNLSKRYYERGAFNYYFHSSMDINSVFKKSLKLGFIK